MGHFTLLGGRYCATGTEQRLKGGSAIQGVQRGDWRGSKLRSVMKTWNLSAMPVTLPVHQRKHADLITNRKSPTYKIVTFSTALSRVRSLSTTCTDRAVQLKPELENSWASSTAALPFRRLSYRATVFYRNLHFITFEHVITSFHIYIYIYIYIYIHRVSQEERTKLREGVPYVKLYRYNPKHLYPKFDCYGDIEHRKVRAFFVSAYSTLSVTSYS